MRVPQALVSRPSRGIGLHHRHVLQRGGVEHQLRPDVGEHRAQPGLVPHVGDHARRGSSGWRLGQLQVDLPQRVLAVVQQDQQRRRQGRHLPRELRADGAARAGHQHPASPHQARMPSRSSGTCGRFSRSSIATGASSSRRRRGCSAVGRGARRTGTPAASACRQQGGQRGPSSRGLGHHQRRGQPALRRSRASTAPHLRHGPGSAWPCDAAAGRPRPSRPTTRKRRAASACPARAGTGRPRRRRRPAARARIRRHPRARPRLAGGSSTRGAPSATISVSACTIGKVGGRQRKAGGPAAGRTARAETMLPPRRRAGPRCRRTASIAAAGGTAARPPAG